MDGSRTDRSYEVSGPLPFMTTDSKRFMILIAFDLAVFAVLVVLTGLFGQGGPQLALIPTLIAVTATKFFGKKKDEDSVFGDHPAVAFTFDAFATGEFKDVDEMVAEDFTAYANGYTVVEPDSGNGPVQFVENITHWRKAVPNLSVAIYDEVSQKDPDKTDTIAVRFVFTGTLTTPELQHDFEVEAASFIKVVDHKLVEWRVVVDTAFLDEITSVMGHPLT
jgi:hypothetical protein